jgi:hypothetical protein
MIDNNKLNIIPIFDDMMIDIETLGNGSDAIVVSIGAVLFNRNTGEIGPKFYKHLAYQDQVDKGRKVTASTIAWWMSQDDDARKNAFTRVQIPTRQALIELQSFIQDNTLECKPWGNGPSFDLTILENLFKDFNVEFPWHFRHVRCLRTFKELVYDGKDLVRDGVHHDALDDAVHQAKIVIEGIKRKNNE